MHPPCYSALAGTPFKSPNFRLCRPGNLEYSGSRVFYFTPLVPYRKNVRCEGLGKAYYSQCTADDMFTLSDMKEGVRALTVTYVDGIYATHH